MGDGPGYGYQSTPNREVHVRFWESAGLKCTALLAYLHAYATVAEAKAGIGAWLEFYNTERQHQSLACNLISVLHCIYNKLRVRQMAELRAIAFGPRALRSQLSRVNQG
jgi:hypothetical protein